MSNLISEIHEQHKAETNRQTMTKESHDPLALFLGIVFFIVTLVGAIAIPLAVNQVWIGLVEVVWFFVGFGWTGKLLSVKNHHDAGLARSL
jgi:hypothetical protein